MDPLTNSLAAFALGRTGLSRVAPRGQTLLIVSVNLPDLDFVSVLFSPVNLLTFVGGPLHSLPLAPLLAALLAGGIWLATKRTFPLARMYTLAMAGLLLRLILDLMPIQGIQLFYPFRDDWVSVGVLPYTDPWLLLLLLAFGFWPLISHMVNVEMGIRRVAGQGLALVTLLLAVLYCGYRASNIAEALSVIPNYSYQGEVPLREMCYPNTFSLARVHCALETDSHVVEIDYFLGSEFDATEGQVLRKQPGAPWQMAQYQSSYFRQIEPRLKMPYWQTYPADYPANASEAILRDIVLAPEPYPLFRLRVLLDGDDRLLEESIRIEIGDLANFGETRSP